jgi:threonine/homoserine/homoserine lactone efflux protein
VIVAPGPDNILVLTRRIARSCAGLGRWGECGPVAHSASAAVGLSAVLAQSATAYSAVEYVGAVYLIYLGSYLGSKALLSKDSFVVSEEAAPWHFKGFSCEVCSRTPSNSKVALFFLTFLPQFADPG